MQKLSDRDVVKLHRWSQQQVPKRQIAQWLQVHRNTITAHLAGRVAYSPELILRLGLSPQPLPAASQQRMTIYQAAAILPDQPSPSRLHRLIDLGVLRTERVGRRLWTRHTWVRSCARKMFDPGLYFRSESLWIYSDRPDELLRSLQGKKFVSPYCGARWQMSYYPAPIVVAVSDALELSLRIPQFQIRMAVAGLEAVGAYVL